MGMMAKQRTHCSPSTEACQGAVQRSRRCARSPCRSPPQDRRHRRSRCSLCGAARRAGNGQGMTWRRPLSPQMHLVLPSPPSLLPREYQIPRRVSTAAPHLPQSYHPAAQPLMVHPHCWATPRKSALGCKRCKIFRSSGRVPQCMPHTHRCQGFAAPSPTSIRNATTLQPR